MTFKNVKLIGIGWLVFCLTSTASATNFWKTGKITRILTDSEAFGGCMVHITDNIGNGCPNNGWVSLDCTNTFYTDSNKKLAIALTAYSLDKKVSVFIDNTKKHSGYCLARRVDLR